MSASRKQAVTFQCGGELLVGVLSSPASSASRGVLIVVGGPQYRAGSHRQFTLLARHLAGHGIPALRFDYRGMGDSGGERRSFEQVEEDIGCAIDRFLAAVPALKEVVIWGLCDAASAALFYGHRDPRVSGLVLVNPWVRTEAGEARTHLRHYYGRRLFQPDLWRKIVRGKFDLVKAATGFVTSLIKGSRNASRAALPERMLDGLRRYRGRVLFILSGDDLTAREFADLVAASPEWRRELDAQRVTRHDLPEANHTFARRAWRDQVARWTEEWVKSF